MYVCVYVCISAVNSTRLKFVLYYNLILRQVNNTIKYIK